MPKISDKKEEKISEHIIQYLFTISPTLKFTSQIAFEIARDEEYTKKVLLKLEQKGLVVKVNKNPQGFTYGRRNRWRIATKAYEAMKQMINT